MNPLRNVCRHNTAEGQDQIKNDQGLFGTVSATVTIPSSGTTSPTISIKNFGQGGFIIPSGFTGTAVSYLVSDVMNGTFVALASTTTTVAASNAYAFPAAVMAFNYVQIVSNATEAGARIIRYSLKH